MKYQMCSTHLGSKGPLKSSLLMCTNVTSCIFFFFFNIVVSVIAGKEI